MPGHHYISTEFREKIHKIFLAGPGTLAFASPHAAISVRRTIYRERARLRREEPGSILSFQANSLIFKLDGNKIQIVHERDEPTLEKTLDTAVRHASS